MFDLMPDARFTLLIGSRNYSSWSLRAWLAMRLSGLDFLPVLYDLRGPSRSEIEGASPSGMVPVLKITREGRVPVQVWDSLAIAETIAEMVPPGRLWPEDADTRAQARSVSAEMHSGFAELRRTCPMDIAHSHPDHVLNEETERQVARIAAIWALCRQQHHRDGDFLFGTLSIADCFFAPVVTRFHTYHVPLKGAAQEYAAAIREWAPVLEWSREAVREETRRAA